MPEVAGLALYGAAASRAAVVALIGAVSAVARFGVIAFAAMARVCGCRVGRAVVVQRLQWTGMTGVCRWVVSEPALMTWPQSAQAVSPV